MFLFVTFQLTHNDSFYLRLHGKVKDHRPLSLSVQSLYTLHIQVWTKLSLGKSHTSRLWSIGPFSLLLFSVHIQLCEKPGKYQTQGTYSSLPHMISMFHLNTWPSDIVKKNSMIYCPIWNQETPHCSVFRSWPCHMTPLQDAMLSVTYNSSQDPTLLRG